MSKLEIISGEDFTTNIADRFEKILNNRDRSAPFHIFLSGGSTPKPIYRALSSRGIDWSQVHFWWGDERFVPHDHIDSNYRMVREQLLDRVAVPANQIHPWPILSTPALSAEAYDSEFRQIFVRDQQPLHLQILGMGDDGHTASLFPQTRALDDQQRMCVDNRVESNDSVRLTLTYPALALSQRIIFVLKGEGKAQTLKEVLEDGRHPSAKVRGVGEPEFWVDTSAASALSQQAR